jgi:hypothetical protein
MRRIRAKFADYFKAPHSFTEYDAILRTALEHSYQILTLESFIATPSPSPTLILRHDIDNNPRAALDFAAIEESHGARATYFFRLNTWDDRVIARLAGQGHEIGYHFEETATFAKARHIRDKLLLLDHYDQIRAQFCNNLNYLRSKSGLKLTAVASHGDFANMLLNLGNRQAISDPKFREACNIAYEAYDKEIPAAYGVHISDGDSLRPYSPYSPLVQIEKRESFLFLSHPRWWKTDPLSNIGSDLRMSFERLVW